MYAHEREFGVAVGADRVCRLWRWTIDDLASSISCCSLRKARRAAYTVAYSLSLSPTSPGRTRAAARSVIAGCPECSASLSIFLLLCLPDAVNIEIKLSARRQLISVGVLSVVGVRAQVQAHAAERGYGGDLRGEINCVQVARILITTLQQTIYILRRSCIHESYIYSIYQYIGCHKSVPPPVSAPCRVAAPLKLRRQIAALALAQSERLITAHGPLAPSSLRQRELVEDRLLELVRVRVRVKVRVRVRVS